MTYIGPLSHRKKQLVRLIKSSGSHEDVQHGINDRCRQKV